MKKHLLLTITATLMCACTFAKEQIMPPNFTNDTDALGPLELSFYDVFSDNESLLTTQECQTLFKNVHLDKTGSFQSKDMTFGPAKSMAIQLDSTTRARVWTATIASPLLKNGPINLYGSAFMTVANDQERGTGPGTFTAGPCHGLLKGKPTTT